MSSPARRRLMRDFKVCGNPSQALRDPAQSLFVGLCSLLIVLRSLTNDKLQRMQTDPPAGVSASPIPDNVMTWYEAAVMSWTG